MEKELCLSIKITNYPTKILATASTRAKYFKPQHKLAKKYLTQFGTVLNIGISNGVVDKNSIVYVGKGKDGNKYVLRNEYIWKKVGKNYRLHNISTNEDVIANPRKVGTERWLAINGQDIFGQRIHEFTKSKIVNSLKNFWKEQITKTRTDRPGDFSLEAIKYPVSVHINYRTTISDNADLDNYSLPYHKTLIDSLVETGVLRGDTIKDIDGIKLTYEPIGKEYLEDIMKTWGNKIENTITVSIYANRI